MGILDWFTSRPKRSSNAVARDLADAVFALHPSAADKVVLTVDARHLVLSMQVPSVASDQAVDASIDPALQTARISELVKELAHNGPPVAGNELTVMRDRVIWMPSVIPFQS